MFEKFFSLKKDKGPKYYMCARRDDGFIAAYRAYFILQGRKIQKIRGLRYNYTVIYSKKANDWKSFSPTHVVFNIKAKNTDPAGWKIEQNKYDRVRYDRNALTELLSKVQIRLRGYIQLVLHEFDGYQLIDMTQTDQEGHGTILGSQSLAFKDGQPLRLRKKIHLDDLSDFYKKT